MSLDVPAEISKLEIESGYWAAVLSDAADRGYPVGSLAARSEEIHEEALRIAALLNGEQLYTVELRYEGIRKGDEEEALYAAFTSDGDLVEKRIEVAEDPSETIERYAPPAARGQEEDA